MKPVFVKVGRNYINMHQINTILEQDDWVVVKFHNGAYFELRGEEAEGLLKWLADNAYFAA